jgi:hypothetical protein
MASFRPDRLIRLAGFALAAVAFFGSARPASAACGDYIHTLPNLHHLLTGQPPADHGPVPCTAPGCQRAPAHAPSPVPPTPPVRVVDALLAAVVGIEPTAGDWPPIDSDAAPTSVPSSLFRPPRG